MKRILIHIAVAVSVMLILNYVYSPKADGKNIKVDSETESSVMFYPVCPECNHVSEMYSVNISKGESHSTIHMCEKCYEVYDIEIER